MQETLNKLQLASGGSQASEEVRERRMQAASEAAAEINASLEAKNNASLDESTKPKQTSTNAEIDSDSKSVATGVLIHWSGVRGFGILKSQKHGEVNVRAKSFQKPDELAVGALVSFELGFDKKKNKPEAVNCCKVGDGESGDPALGEAGSAFDGAKAEGNARTAKSPRKSRGKSESEQESDDSEKTKKKTKEKNAKSKSKKAKKDKSETSDESESSDRKHKKGKSNHKKSKKRKRDPSSSSSSSSRSKSRSRRKRSRSKSKSKSRSRGRRRR